MEWNDIKNVFNKHFTFYSSFLGMNYSNVIGFLLFLVFLLQFMSGILLSCYYSAFYTIAFDSVYYIMIDVNFGWFIRWLHCLGASLFMFFIFLHWLRGYYLRFKVIDSLHWILVSGWVIFGISLIEGFLGYILNWGQMSYWGITVMINILSIFGDVIGELLWCSSNVIINRIFVFHFSLGWFIGCFIFVHIFVLHSFSSSNPLFNSCSSLIVPFFPLFFNDCFVSLIVCSLFFSFFLFWEPDLFGNCDNLIFANPLSTPNHILPEWYFLIYYSCLRAFPNKTMGVIISLIFILVTFHSVSLLKQRHFAPFHLILSWSLLYNGGLNCYLQLHLIHYTLIILFFIHLLN